MREVRMASHRWRPPHVKCLHNFGRMAEVSVMHPMVWQHSRRVVSHRGPSVEGSIEDLCVVGLRHVKVRTDLHLVEVGAARDIVLVLKSGRIVHLLRIEVPTRRLLLVGLLETLALCLVMHCVWLAVRLLFACCKRLIHGANVRALFQVLI